MVVGGHHKLLEIKFEELHDLAAVKHRDGHLPEWSVDSWLRRHAELGQVEQIVVKKGKFKSEVCPSDNIATAKRAPRGREKDLR